MFDDVRFPVECDLIIKNDFGTVNCHLHSGAKMLRTTDLKEVKIFCRKLDAPVQVCVFTG
jgi:hypothetical protein